MVNTSHCRTLARAKPALRSEGSESLTEKAFCSPLRKMCPGKTVHKFLTSTLLFNVRYYIFFSL